jgi:O-antigen/teichoic acid export membrane protein
MASAESAGYGPDRTTTDRTLDHGRRANPIGAYVATAGVVIFLIAVFAFDWINDPNVDDRTASGYETDPLIPWLAYFGLGLVVALFYAMSRARGRQHRGLSLVTMAVGVGVVGLTLSYLFDAPGILDVEIDYEAQAGVWIALIGGILWAVGAGLLAKEPEGDDDWHDSPAVTGTRRGL